MRHQAWLYKRASKKRDLLRMEFLLDLANDMLALSNELNPRILIRTVRWQRSQQPALPTAEEDRGGVLCDGDNAGRAETKRLLTEYRTACLEHRRLSRTIVERLDRAEINTETGSSCSSVVSVGSSLGEAIGREEVSILSMLQTFRDGFSVCDECRGLFHEEYRGALFVEQSKRHERYAAGNPSSLSSSSTTFLCIHCWHLRAQEKNRKQTRNSQPMVSTRNRVTAGTFQPSLEDPSRSERFERHAASSVRTTPISVSSATACSSRNIHPTNRIDPQPTKAGLAAESQTKKHDSLYGSGRFQSRKQILRDRAALARDQRQSQSQPETETEANAEASLAGSAGEWSISSSASNLRFEMQETRKSLKLTRRDSESGSETGSSPPCKTHSKLDDKTEPPKPPTATATATATPTTASRKSRLASMKFRMNSCAVLDSDHSHTETGNWDEDSWGRYGTLDSSICSNSIAESLSVESAQSQTTGTTWTCCESSDRTNRSTAESLWSRSSIGSTTTTTTSLDWSLFSTSERSTIKSAMKQKTLMGSIASIGAQCSPTKVQDFPCGFPTAMGRNKPPTKHVRFQTPLVEEGGSSQPSPPPPPPPRQPPRDELNASTELESGRYFCNCDTLLRAF
eukprot:jgi/Psemu1/289966/fgenesh1_pg.431_\